MTRIWRRELADSFLHPCNPRNPRLSLLLRERNCAWTAALAREQVSLEPGISFSRGKDFFSFNLPLTVKGHGSASVTDRRTQSPYAGIVTLADKQLIFAYSRRF